MAITAVMQNLTHRGLEIKNALIPGLAMLVFALCRQDREFTQSRYVVVEDDTK